MYSGLMGWRKGAGGFGGGYPAVPVLVQAEYDTMVAGIAPQDRSLLLWGVRKFHAAAMDLVKTDGA